MSLNIKPNQYYKSSNMPLGLFHKNELGAYLKILKQAIPKPRYGLKTWRKSVTFDK